MLPPQEYNDAQTAQLWLASHCHPNRPWPAAAVQLIERYGELFDPAGNRSLRCRQCLSLRYGEVKRNTGSMGGRGSGRAATHRQTPVRQEPHPPAKRHLTEQSLFLTNLPKLLAKPKPPVAGDESASPRNRPHEMSTGACVPGGRKAGARAACRPGPAPKNSSRPASDRGTQPNPIDSLSPSDRDKLLLLFAGKLPAFKTMAQAKQLPR